MKQIEIVPFWIKYFDMMTKRHWVDSIKSLGSYIDPEQDEQVKKTKIDLDDRVANLMKHIQHKSRSKKGGGPIFDSELIELIDDFHKKYQMLYSLYENLKEEVLEKLSYQDDENKSSSSSASFHSSSELQAFDSLQQLEEMKNECSRLSECLFEKEKELCTQKRKLEELETISKQREENLSILLVKLEENEVNLMSKSEDLMEKANDLKLEVDDLWSKKDIVWHIPNLHKSKSESFLSELNKESSGFLFELELLKVEFERKQMDLQKVVEKKEGLERKVKNYENQMKSKFFENADLVIENEGLHVRVSELEELLNERNYDVFVLETEYEFLEHGSCAQIKALGEEIMSLEEELNEKEEHNTELMSKVEHYEKSRIGNEDAIYKNFEILNNLNAVEAKFQESSGRFMNRISMLSDKVMVAKDWVKTRNENIHEKEDEIIGLRERVRKLENDMREKEEGMLGLGEEKREAIRQLCVWVEYHRGQNDDLKKVLSELHDFRSPRSR